MEAVRSGDVHVGEGPDPHHAGAALLLAVLPPRLDALALDLAPGRKSEHREGSGSRLGVRVADLGARLRLLSADGHAWPR